MGGEPGERGTGKMTQGGGGLKLGKKCHVLFEWSLAKYNVIRVNDHLPTAKVYFNLSFHDIKLPLNNEHLSATTTNSANEGYRSTQVCLYSFVFLTLNLMFAPFLLTYVS